METSCKNLSTQSYQLLIVGGFQRWLEISSCGLLQRWYIGDHRGALWLDITVGPLYSLLAVGFGDVLSPGGCCWVGWGFGMYLFC